MGAVNLFVWTYGSECESNCQCHVILGWNDVHYECEFNHEIIKRSRMTCVVSCEAMPILFIPSLGTCHSQNKHDSLPISSPPPTPALDIALPLATITYTHTLYHQPMNGNMWALIPSHNPDGNGWKTGVRKPVRICATACVISFKFMFSCVMLVWVPCQERLSFATGLNKLQSGVPEDPSKLFHPSAGQVAWALAGLVRALLASTLGRAVLRLAVTSFLHEWKSRTSQHNIFYA